jgi:excisionase family DNA binding protein
MDMATVGSASAATAGLVEDGFLSVAEAAEFLGLCRAKLYLLMDSGDLVYAKFGKARRIPRKALLEYAARCLVG